MSASAVRVADLTLTGTPLSEQNALDTFKSSPSLFFLRGHFEASSPVFPGGEVYLIEVVYVLLRFQMVTVQNLYFISRMLIKKYDDSRIVVIEKYLFTYMEDISRVSFFMTWCRIGV